MTKFAPNPEPFDDFKDAEATLKTVMDRYRDALEKALESQVTKLLGYKPTREEIVVHGHKYTFEDGRVEWYWGNTLILTEPPKFKRADLNDPYASL
jgi:hypothetical protein